MKTLLRGGYVVSGRGCRRADVLIDGEKVEMLGHIPPEFAAQSEVEVQIATQAFRATWREPEGAEYQKIWDFMVDGFPFYADYQKSTSRKIPLVVMKAIEPIPVFQQSDATGHRQYK